MRGVTGLRAAGYDPQSARAAFLQAVVLADGDVSLRQACVSDICEWLRDAWREERWRRLEPEARRLVSEVSGTLRDRFRDPGSPLNWCGLDLDLSRTIIRDLDLRGAHFTGGTVDFSGSIFGEPWFEDLEKPQARLPPDRYFTPFFELACFSGGKIIFDDAIFLGSGHEGAANFKRARFDGAAVSFRRAQFKGGEASFDDIICTAGSIDCSFTEFLDTRVSFTRTNLVGTSKINFQDSMLSAGAMSFSDAKIHSGEINFERAKIYGELSFYGIRIEGGAVVLDFAETSGPRTSFCKTQLNGGKLSFRCWRAVDGIVRFNDMILSRGDVTFDGAIISGSSEIFLDQVSIEGGSLSFADVRVDPGGIVYLPWGTYTFRGGVSVEDGFDGKVRWVFCRETARYDPVVATSWGPFAPGVARDKRLRQTPKGQR